MRTRQKAKEEIEDLKNAMYKTCTLKSTERKCLNIIEMEEIPSLWVGRLNIFKIFILPNYL